MNISEKIKELRAERGLTQGELADKLNISRPTYLLVENGQKELTVTGLRVLANIFDVSLEELIFDTAQVQTNDFGMDKYKQIVLNCLQYGADADGRITKTKLAKLAYLADFAWFYNHLKPMSGLTYRKIQQGPVPDQYFRVVDELFEEGSITIENKGMAFMIKSIENAPENLLEKEETDLIKKISEKWQGKNTKEIVEFTHRQLPWKICRDGEFIPYEIITQEEPANVY